MASSESVTTARVRASSRATPTQRSPLSSSAAAAAATGDAATEDDGRIRSKRTFASWKDTSEFLGVPAIIDDVNELREKLEAIQRAKGDVVGDIRSPSPLPGMDPRRVERERAIRRARARALSSGKYMPGLESEIIDREAPLTERLRFQIDTFMSSGPAARFTTLGVIGFSCVSFLAILAYVVLPLEHPDEFDRFSIGEAFWWALVRVIDTGKFGDDTSFFTRVVAGLSSLVGIVVVASIIGLVTTTIEERFEELRRGRSRVLVSQHCLVLGWDREKTLAVLSELVQANINPLHRPPHMRSKVVVVLSDVDKLEVEEIIRTEIRHLHGTQIIVREGDTFSPAALCMCGADRARSIVILSDREEAHDVGRTTSDMRAIKTLLALRHIEGVFVQNHAIVELNDLRHRDVVQRLGKRMVEVVSSGETLSRLLVQTCRVPGLADVYTEILTFEGSEFYYRNYPELAGKTYDWVLWRMRDATLIGIDRVHLEGRIPRRRSFLNPPADLVLEPADRLLLISHSGDSFGYEPEPIFPSPAIPAELVSGRFIDWVKEPENYLILSCGSKLNDLLAEFLEYLAEGSTVYLMPGIPREEFEEQYLKGRKSSAVTFEYLSGVPTEHKSLEIVLDLKTLNCAVVMANDSLPESETDANTIISVLLLSEVFEALPRRPRIISEIQDARSKTLLQQDVGSEFVLSTVITSRLITQICEQRGLAKVFAELFTEVGSELYTKKAAGYALLGTKTSWAQILHVARAWDETAIGYLPASTGIPVLNVRLQDEIVLEADDRIIVISEDDREHIAH